MLKKTGMSEAMLTFLWGCVITSFQDTPKGRARRVVSIAEILPNPSKPEGMDVIDIFRYRASDDSFIPEDPYEVVSEVSQAEMVYEGDGLRRRTYCETARLQGSGG
jgi:hypothetical protein